MRKGRASALTRKHGLTVDNLISADVVLADGRLVCASEDDNPDLFWAIRGGGGNFGVVTSFELRLHPVDTVIGGPMFWPIEALDKTLSWYRHWLPNASGDLYAFYAIHEVPSVAPFPDAHPGRKVCGLVWCCTGSREQADSALADIITQWAMQYESALRPHTSGAAYVNFMMEEGADRVAATYGSNYHRLRRVKARYDPDNFFRINQNIAPRSE